MGGGMEAPLELTFGQGWHRMRKAAEIVDVANAELEEVLRRAEQALDAKDAALVRAVFQSYLYVTDLVEDKKTTIQRLRKLLFGSRTEKTKAVVNNDPSDPPSANDATDTAESPAEVADTDITDTDISDTDVANEVDPEPACPGHGRNGADAYSGGTRVEVPHPSLQPGDPCPACHQGTVYEKPPGVIVRITGQPPLTATIYELQKLRCHLCGQVFTAPPPQEAGSSKYAETAGSMIALLKYGTGLPFNRLEGLQGHLEIPLPASTQWDVVASVAEDLTPVFTELIHQAAQGEVLHNDDTTVKILELMGERARQAALASTTAEGDDGERTGLFTSGVVALRHGHRVALFFSGRKHAGENLAEVLKHRAAELQPPIQMCDALSRNLPDALRTILGNCLAHGRRRFVDIYDRFPHECGYLLESLAVVYRNDAVARERNLTPEERLHWHQQESTPTMKQLHEWLTRQLEDKLVEPNSALGDAIQYMLRHWEKLTLFLRQAGAPLDNNICERALKKAILHRKNSLFYKTQNGARVGDLFMSLIYTCQLNDVNPFDYLTQLQQHAEQVAAAPQRWLPWNYTVALGQDEPALDVA